MSERKPLTLEELRQMHGSSERIGTRVLLRVYSVSGIEGVLDFREDDGICAVYAASGEWLKEKDYGKTWLAYADELPRLDRSAWEPCEYCNGKRTLYQKTRHTRLYMDTFGVASTLVTECSCCPPYVKCCMKDIPANSAFKINFCPECGRPLTDAAWDMLEKRLEGAK